MIFFGVVTREAMGDEAGVVKASPGTIGLRRSFKQSGSV